MRLLFIPGFGEDEYIFDKIQAAILGDKLFLNNWKLIGDTPKPHLTVLTYAKELVQAYNITQDDVIIGHSMGGWIALYIKHLVNCRIVQIGSWTDSRKVVKPIRSTALIYWLIKRGVYFNPVVQKVLTWKHYRNKPSCAIFNAVFERLKKGNKDNVINQLRIIFTPVTETVKVTPDLRIHAREDTVVRYPDEPTHEVPGDHFTLYTHPEKVYQPIVNFLENVYAQKQFQMNNLN